MAIWSAEIKELEKLYESFKGQFPELEKELEQLIRTEDANVIMLYSRRCLEVIITDLCECELKRPRKTEPLKGIIDKLHKEEKVPSYIISSMHGLNELSTYGAHPKDFDPEQVKPVLNNLYIIIKWYLKYKDFLIIEKPRVEEEKYESKHPPEKSIVVLPFENISPDPDQEYFSDGLTEEIITDLSHIHDLLVISRSSAMTFKGTKKRIGEIAKEVNVHYVLEGSVRKAGNNLRITAQLIDGINDSHIWAEKFSGTLDDVFDIQEKVSLSIADALKLKLCPEESQKITDHKIDNTQVYEYYLRAKDEILKFSEDSNNKALKYLQTALEITGDNALLYSGMALAYWNLVNIGAAHEDYLIKSEEYAKKALSIDPETDMAHTVLGYIKVSQGQVYDSYPFLKSALRVNPNEIIALAGIGQIFICAGRMSEGDPYFKKILQIDPLSFPSSFARVAFPFYGGRFGDALKGCQRLFKLYPEVPFSQFYYSLMLVYNNRIDEAIPIIDKYAGMDPDNVLAKLGLILKYSLQGDTEKIMNEMTEDFRKTAEHDYSYAHHLAGILSLANLKSDALDWLETAVNIGFINYPLLNNFDTFLENIRGEERFKKLMERVKYEWENFEV